ncbi:nucleotidyltransferase family protein [Aneurinibacillus danicus]|jgi:hypothetical protein|uniref:Nucleotidyltransferase n=1 Tax=Aneurinibacillus danicus TaxID=267746 RepID=A0A511VDD4_9BACL|nr:nucleotidyltransferase family protein [Aneurinibacillus danicus]GEN36839.1 nucleotidyltransferase [Aneurinibacillus danicus]
MYILDQILLYQTKIIEIGQRYGIHDIRVFGSVARREETPNSDIDLLVSINPDRSLLDLIGFKQELEDFLGRSVDVGTELHSAIYESVAREIVSL